MFERSHLPIPTLFCPLLLGIKWTPRTMPPPPILNVNLTIEWPNSKLQNLYPLSFEYCGLSRELGIVYYCTTVSFTTAPVFCKSQSISIWGWLFLRVLKILACIILSCTSLKDRHISITAFAAVLLSTTLFLMKQN